MASTETGVVPPASTTEGGNSEKAKVMYPGHSHPLTECYVYPGGMGCQACSQPIPPGYSYGCEGCGHYLHIECLPGVHTPLHPQHPLVLRYAVGKNMYPCQICESSVYLTFHCDSCDFHLCVYCTSLFPRWMFEHDGHPFVSIEVGLNEDSAVSRFVSGYACHACGKTGDNKFFKCLAPGCFNFCHFHCIPFDLPPSIKHEYHFHPLTLVERYVDEDMSKHYCDACEEERDPEAPVYRCQECNFNAHTACTISQVLPRLIAEREADPSKVFAPFCVDLVREQLNHKIEELIAKEKRLMSNLEKIASKLDKTERTCASYAAFMQRKV